MPSSPLPLDPKAAAFLPTCFGDFRIFAFAGEDGAPATVLATAAVRDNALVRVHSECETGDVFGSLRCDCGAQLHAAMEGIARDGNGLLIYLRGHEGRGIGIVNKIRAYALQEQGQDTVEANHALGFPADLRRYETAGRILRHFGVSRLRLLSNNPDKVRAMEDMGLVVSLRVPLIEGANPHNEEYLETKRRKMGHFGE